MQYVFGNCKTCDPSVLTMDHPGFIVCSFMENSIGSKSVKIHDAAQIGDNYLYNQQILSMCFIAPQRKMIVSNAIGHWFSHSLSLKYFYQF